MLELPFDLSLFARQPGYAVGVAYVIPVVALLFFGGLLRIPPLKYIAQVCAGAFALCWPFGFSLATIMILVDIGGLHILLSWLILLLGSFSFVLFNHRRLAMITEEYTSPERKKTPRGPRGKRRIKR